MYALFVECFYARTNSHKPARFSIDNVKSPFSWLLRISEAKKMCARMAKFLKSQPATLWTIQKNYWAVLKNFWDVPCFESFQLFKISPEFLSFQNVHLFRFLTFQNFHLFWKCASSQIFQLLRISNFKEFPSHTLFEKSISPESHKSQKSTRHSFHYIQCLQHHFPRIHARYNFCEISEVYSPLNLLYTMTTAPFSQIFHQL